MAGGEGASAAPPRARLLDELLPGRFGPHDLMEEPFPLLMQPHDNKSVARAEHRGGHRMGCKHYVTPVISGHRICYTEPARLRIQQQAGDSAFDLAVESALIEAHKVTGLIMMRQDLIQSGHPLSRNLKGHSLPPYRLTAPTPAVPRELQSSLAMDGFSGVDGCG